MGARWRIENGQKTRIWHDKWLPNQLNFKIWSPRKELEDSALVSELIDPDTKQWNRELVFACFHPIEAKQILSILISHRLPEDIMICQWEKDGNYSVRTAYHQMQEVKERDNPSSSNGPNNALCIEIWRAKLPNRVKNFLWRLAKNILPTRANLGRKGVNIDTSCPLCHSENETTEHLFMRCHLARLTWFSSSLDLHVPHEMDLTCWILQGLTCEDLGGAKLFCLLLWKFWKATNQAVFRNKPVNPVEVSQSTMTYMQEIDCSVSMTLEQVQNTTQNSHVVVLNTENTIFVDAGCFAGGTTGWGIVILDSTCSTIYSARRTENIEVEPVLAEALVMRWSLQEAATLNLQNIKLFSDAESVVNCLNSNVCNAAIDPIILDCKLLLSQFVSAQVAHVRRQFNGLAHSLVGLSRSVGNKTWMGGLPYQLDVVACNPFSVSV